MRKIFLFASAMFCAFTIAAQDIVEGIVVEGDNPASAAKSNWFFGAGAGAQVFYGDHDRHRKFSERISPALDVFVGKWVTPSVGFRLMYSGLNVKGATQDVGTVPNVQPGPFSTGKNIGNGTWLTESKIDFMNLHFDVMFDLCNMIGGYNPSRIYSVIPYLGVGYAHTWNLPHKDAIMANFGILNSFHVAKRLDINLDLRATGYPDTFDGEDGRRAFDGLLGVTAGLTYRFGPQGWNRTREIITVYDNDKVNALREEVDALNRELENKEVQTQIEVKQVASDYVVYFPIGVSSLSNVDKGQLEFVAKAILSTDNNLTYSITGYADKATGTPQINERLSRQRAENVRAYLIREFGIDGKRLKVDWKGGVGNMFLDDPALSRAVIVRPE